MTNPTPEQRAREIAIAAHDAEHGPGITLTNPAPWIVNAILEAFSHTGVEQAIEACAKVAEGARSAFEKVRVETPDGDAHRHLAGKRDGAITIAAAIRATLPAQSPDDIAYAGAAERAIAIGHALDANDGGYPPPPSPVNVEGLVEAFEEALTPSGSTKAAYRGEFSFDTEDGVSDAGIEQYRKVYVPWDTAKEIMAAIRGRVARSALASLSPDGER